MPTNVPILGGTPSKLRAAAFPSRQSVQDYFPDFLELAGFKLAEALQTEGFAVSGLPPFAFADDVAVLEPLQVR